MVTFKGGGRGRKTKQESYHRSQRRRTLQGGNDQNVSNALQIKFGEHEKCPLNLQLISHWQLWPEQLVKTREDHIELRSE